MSSFSPRRVYQALAALVCAAVITTAHAAPDVGADEALAQVRAGEATLIDIRTPAEWKQTGVAEGALTIDMTKPTFVDEVLAAVDGDRAAPIVLICRTGNRTNFTRNALERMGFSNVTHVAEGMAGSRAGPGWVKRGLPVQACQTC
jgi:rhodanese-related sulfurtransferase